MLAFVNQKSRHAAPRPQRPNGHHDLLRPARKCDEDEARPTSSIACAKRVSSAPKPCPKADICWSRRAVGISKVETRSTINCTAWPAFWIAWLISLALDRLATNAGSGSV